jgi:hypothetical protein
VTPLLHLLGPCLLIITICYLLRCAASPWGACRRCHGNPRRRRTCHRCDGTGKRTRLAWRALGYLYRTWKDSTR